MRTCARRRWRSAAHGSKQRSPAFRRRRTSRRRRSTADVARDWFQRFEGAGLDGVVAKRLDDVYRPGARAMLKIKHLRTVDCVVGGFRWNKGEQGQSVGSLLLGLYDDAGVLGYVGHTSSFKAAEKRALVETLAPYRHRRRARGLRRRPDAGWAQPLDRRPRRRLGARTTRAGLRSHVRPPAGRALPPCRDVPPLASR